MKTKEELNNLKEEVETQNKKLHELTDEELEQVSGGTDEPPKCAVYQSKGKYQTCPNPRKGTCKQCPMCELNVT